MLSCSSLSPTCRQWRSRMAATVAAATAPGPFLRAYPVLLSWSAWAPYWPRPLPWPRPHSGDGRWRVGTGLANTAAWCTPPASLTPAWRPPPRRRPATTRPCCSAETQPPTPLPSPALLSWLTYCLTQLPPTPHPATPHPIPSLRLALSLSFSKSSLSECLGGHCQ